MLVSLGFVSLGLIHAFFVVGIETARLAWKKGKGLVAPLIVVFIVLGSIYGGITGITEAAGIGSVAVLLLMPVFLPNIKKLPIAELGLFGPLDAYYVSVWFGILFCVNMQVSFLSPPLGPAAFCPSSAPRCLSC